MNLLFARFALLLVMAVAIVCAASGFGNGASLETIAACATHPAPAACAETHLRQHPSPAERPHIVQVVVHADTERSRKPANWSRLLPGVLR